MAACELAGNSHLKASEPNNECPTEHLPPAQPENRTEQGQPLQETLSSDLGNDSRVVHQSGLPEDVHAASVHVCEVMDKLGYSEAMVRYRQGAYRKCDIRQKWVTTGSKGEGLSSPFESDTDKIFFKKNILCKLPGHASLQLPDINTVFIMDGEHCHPGHFWLELDHMGKANVKGALFVHTNGKTYFSSLKFTERQKTIVQSVTGPTYTVSGPAVTHAFKWDSMDTVLALLIQQPMLSEWISRPRHHSWPSPELIQEISQLPAYLVPVGCKGSETKHMEWRVCFLGEQKLTHSFTECQYKLYIILKFLMKAELKPICDEMSSYIVKNIVFWFIESNQQELFSKENILKNLLSCLQKLQQAIRDDGLSYYMFPGRNLLIGRINKSQQQQLIAKLDELIQEGPRVILRCPKVLEALYNMSPTELTEKGQRREEIEKLCLEWNYIMMKYRNLKDGWQQLEKDPGIITVKERIFDILWPLWRLYPFERITYILNKKIEDALS